ncbi:unnamed protein product [Dovyalis caffra]|uniref:Uncharacterized protein n=1 Tax=Dovyalis caffra TaxID=77055 RepID=A0AAV1SKU0_9ROSI|nr:unnamed protein product [Dovyalis caffra]
MDIDQIKTKLNWAVRRMKTSPLTAEETERIQEGLRVYKLDWLSVWKSIVPHRDPSLLPRQLRIALGTQKSYKQDAAKKEKRRVSEAKKRYKTTELVNWKPASDKEDNQADRTGGGNSSGDDCIDNANEAYVHQAFLSDWRPGPSSLISSDTLLREDSNTREHPNNRRPGEAQLWIDNMNGFPYGSGSHQCPLTHVKTSPPNTVLPNHQISNRSLNTSKSQIHLRPYRSRKTDGLRLVRLAPDLPPVNLPRSVRIISQSAFKNNQCGSSIKVSASGSRTGDARRDNIAYQLPHVGNLRSSSVVDTRRDKSNQATDNVTDSHPEEPAVVHNAIIVDGRGTDSDLQMHPLLFQAPEGGRLPYLPLGCNNGTSSSFSFFSGNQPQLNLSLLHNPHQANHVVGSFTKSLKSKDSTSASCSIDFHPLLQTDEENSNLVMASSNPNQFVCLRGESTQLQNHFDAVQNKSSVNQGPFTVDPEQCCSNEKANNLDLEIHLSSNSVKEISQGGRDAGANNQPWSALSEPKSGRRIETCNINSPHDQHTEHCPTVHGNPVSGPDASPVPSNNVSLCDMDDGGDQSHPEIVMEQEELSDSDEEIEENVEFECEEMADSDGEEGAGCKPVAELQDKDAQNFAMEEVTNAEDYGDQHCELRSSVHSHGKPSILRKGSPLLNLSLTSLGKETTNSSWLSLDSHAPVDSSRMKVMHEKGVISECPAAKNLSSCRPSRLCKKTTPSTKVETQKDVSDIAQQLSLGPLAVSTLRKPRKRSCRTNTNLGTRIAAENSGTNAIRALEQQPKMADTIKDN